MFIQFGESILLSQIVTAADPIVRHHCIWQPRRWEDNIPTVLFVTSSHWNTHQQLSTPDITTDIRWCLGHLTADTSPFAVRTASLTPKYRFPTLGSDRNGGAAAAAESVAGHRDGHGRDSVDGSGVQRQFELRATAPRCESKRRFHELCFAPSRGTCPRVSHPINHDREDFFTG